MLELFYHLYGLNKTLFIQINKITNINDIPYILDAISSLFDIYNFAVVYFFTCIYFYFETKRARDTEAYFTPIYNELVRIGTCYTVFGLTFAGLKFSVNLPRPFCSLDSGQFITIASTEFERCLSSFPSAHTGLSILATYAIWPHVSKKIKFFCCLIITAVATSRISLAMHYPADIIYSVIVTIFIIILGNFIYRTLKPSVIEPIRTFIIRLIFS
jgi:membrane-associated phospholipid phosphatase